jgi:tetratricopeptide (TPR) repeat protein
MFESLPLEPPIRTHIRSYSAMKFVRFSLLFVASCLAASGHGQNNPNSVERYANAIRQSTVAGQIEAMERYLTVAENGVLKQDALEVLVWDYTRTGSFGHVKQRAQELLELDRNNPVALAALAEQVVEQGGAYVVVRGKKKRVPAAREMRQKVERTKAALAALENLRKPEGMLDGDFAALRRYAEARLDGVLGMTYVEAEDYQDAKTPLQEAVASDPANAQYAYGLGLALLLAKENDPGRAYWYLARAADLTQGTAEGSAISEFARKSYRKAGGNDAGWQKFLAAAAVPPPRQSTTVVASISPSASSSSGGAPAEAGSALAARPANRTTSTPSMAGRAPGVAAPASNAPAGPQSPAVAMNPSGSAQTASSASPQNTPGTPTSGGPAAIPSVPAPSAGPPSNATMPAQAAASTRQASSAGPRQTEMAAAMPPDVGRQPVKPPQPRPEVLYSPNPPVSLGILIETALLTGNNRPAIISTLREVVRHLRPGDEACILVFSNQLDFEQDLTGNDVLLTEAMQNLRPHPGKALLEGVAFAAGHLKRIGKNANRILLVVSDGRNTKGNTQPLTVTSQISGVKIDSIGMNVGDSAGRVLLSRLAEVTGGETSFVAGPEEFRIAAARITNTMGIPIP